MLVVEEVREQMEHLQVVRVEMVVVAQVLHLEVVLVHPVLQIVVVEVVPLMVGGDNRMVVVERVVSEQTQVHLEVEHLRKQYLLQQLEQHIQLRLVRERPLLVNQVTEVYQIKIHHPEQVVQE
jgi:hypothetical protein